jgi:hypothetical protein
MAERLAWNPARMDPEPNHLMSLPTAGGTMDQWPYFFWGAGLMAVKYNLDRAIAIWGFHRSWFFWNYIKPGGFAGIDAVTPDDRRFYYILLLTSLPFVFAGVAFTLRRLRSAGLSPAFCILFFLPVINLIFFVVLAMIPARMVEPAVRAEPGWHALVPTSAMGSAMASMVVVGTLGVVTTLFSVKGLGDYGWGLFVGLPFTMGMVSVMIHGARQKRSMVSCIFVSMLPVLFTGIGLFGLAVEGIFCLIMASPIALALAIFGGLIGYAIVEQWHRRVGSAALCVIFASVPLTMGFEKQAGETPPVYSVTSSVVINAPAETVWANVIAFSEIPDQRELLFHTGIAYPIKARIDGAGVGAVRHCIFSTGEFVEPITFWEEPQVLRFSVAQQPEPMEELSPYPRLNTPHLHGYLRSHAGEFRLTTLPDGRTLLAGTTWYTDQIWPSPYWKLWSDYIIHHIHLRVLNHIKAVSENTPG